MLTSPDTCIIIAMHGLQDQRSLRLSRYSSSISGKLGFSMMPYFILTHCSAPPESLAEPVKSQEPVARGEDPEVCAGANVDNSGGGGEEKVDQKLSNTEKE